MWRSTWSARGLAQKDLVIVATVLAHYGSKSRPGSAGYNILSSEGGHEIYCECPAWKFQKGKGPQGRRCKHLDDYWKKENLRVQKILPATVWDRLTAELFSDEELKAPPAPKKTKRKPKGSGPTAWERLNEDEG